MSQNSRLEKVLEHVGTVQDLCNVLGMDFFRTITEVHSSLDDSIGKEHKNISNDTLSKLDRAIATLNEDKRLRLKKVFLLPVLYLANMNHYYPACTISCTILILCPASRSCHSTL